MPRYFFHAADGGREPDLKGTVLPDDAAAQYAAVQFAGETLRWNSKDLWNRGQWRVEVTDERGALLFTVITLAVDAPRQLPREPEPGAND